ncbi:hypothetical protein BDA96_05G201300 [Sorghum bicolor]|uniref:Uncharacterized protein n=2 Tax=Sorghum bicolor TaxID=4558 RepID=A0A921UGB0_SORBI|nr:hypothetical protein BDA96_05G201300 [Sorghum bicolor]KXG28924.1 hypothetical protein SORBI_3005G184900 [Sorghum bicolor]
MASSSSSFSLPYQIDWNQDHSELNIFQLAPLSPAISCLRRCPQSFFPRHLRLQASSQTHQTTPALREGGCPLAAKPARPCATWSAHPQGAPARRRGASCLTPAGHLPDAATLSRYIYVHKDKVMYIIVGFVPHDGRLLPPLSQYICSASIFCSPSQILICSMLAARPPNNNRLIHLDHLFEWKLHRKH